MMHMIQNSGKITLVNPVLRVILNDTLGHPKIELWVIYKNLVV